MSGDDTDDGEDERDERDERDGDGSEHVVGAARDARDEEPADGEAEGEAEGEAQAQAEGEAPPTQPPAEGEGRDGVGRVARGLVLLPPLDEGPPDPLAAGDEGEPEASLRAARGSRSERRTDESARRAFVDVGPANPDWAHEGTRIGGLDTLSSRLPLGLLFARHYPAILRTKTALESKGVVLAIVHGPSRQLVGRAWLTAPAEGANSLVIGRHEEADLPLFSSDVSNRQLVVLLHAEGPRGLTYEVVDVSDGVGIHGEDGQRLEAAMASGPAVLRFGEHVLFALPSEPSVPWPEAGTDAWQALPPRHLERSVDEAARRPRPHFGRSPSRRPEGDRSVITMAPSVTRIESLAIEDAPGAGRDEPALGLLTLERDGAFRSLRLTQRTLARGLLIGRAPRCGFGDLLRHDSLSRVHLLIKSIGDEVWLFDTCSSNGTYFPDDDPPEPIRAASLRGPITLVLADDVLTLRWRPRRRRAPEPDGGPDDLAP